MFVFLLVANVRLEGRALSAAQQAALELSGVFAYLMCLISEEVGLAAAALPSTLIQHLSTRFLWCGASDPNFHLILVKMLFLRKDQIASLLTHFPSPFVSFSLSFSSRS